MIDAVGDDDAGAQDDHDNAHDDPIAQAAATSGAQNYS